MTNVFLRASFVPLRDYGFNLDGSDDSPVRGSKCMPALL